MNHSNPTDNLKDNDSIYLVGGGEFEEADRAIGISVMGVGLDGGGIFSRRIELCPGVFTLSEFKAQWIAWLEESFRDILSEPFIQVYLATAGMRIGRMTELDNKIDQELGCEDRDASQDAGIWFLEGKNEMRRAPQWQKFARCVEQGECPGHLVTVFALQAALYHLPLLSALTSYVYFEWRAALYALGKKENLAGLEISPQYFHEGYPESMKVVREVFARDTLQERAISGL